ncbi:MAG: radical SAM family heme chaperone HemW [Paludibacteraceae bacterium]|nr:radical SAM family heme chaperone HemW [Paludibacteraceae bacterium]
MAGVYIHIPFCKSRCQYCDFYSTTQLHRQEEYIDTILREIDIRQTELQSHDIETIYFGGGTPSLLDPKYVDLVLKKIAYVKHTLSMECTLEANPGDLTPQKLLQLRAIGINRLSIGIQSFNDRLLQLIGRRHNAAQAIQVVHDAQAAGFDNLSIDLIYGLPTQTMDDWKQTIQTAFDLNVQHISCYCLSYEDNTPLTRLLEAGKINEIDEDTENEMYDYLCTTLKANGFIHYEVSNFAKPNFQSKHNSNYWNNTPYIGLGAASHSYDGLSRSWNPSDLDAYIEGVQAGTLVREQETLTPEQIHEEQIMLGLRTNQGIDLNLVQPSKAQAWIQRGLLTQQNGRLIATQSGLHILNCIIEDLL